nr:MAG: holliday junction resolvase [Bacteriophage sp.]
MKRSGKFYYKNERETLEALGFKQIPGSGNGWIAKEDGESDNTLVQLKSTENASYTVSLLDLKKLEIHAETENKFPLFLIQFLKQDKIYALVSIENLEDLNDMIKTGKVKERTVSVQESTTVKRKKISSSSSAIKSYRKEQESKWQKKKT